MRERLAKSTTLVAQFGNEIAGFSSIGAGRDADLDSEIVGEVYALYVRPSWWRTGVGRRLCGASLMWLKEHGFKRVSLCVLEKYAVGRCFYERLGFAPDGAESSYDAGGTARKELRLAIDI